VGFVLLGIASMTTQGLQGALVQMLNMGLISTGLFFLAGSLHARLGSSDLEGMGGIAKGAPVLSAFFFLSGLASIGLPGTSGFVGEHLILLGAFRANHAFACAAVLGVVLGAAYFLRYFERAFLGPATRPSAATIPDLVPRERAIALVLCALILGIGLRPSAVLDMTRASIEALARRAPPLEDRSPSATADLGSKGR
jgi:NADH-quinone oxidoreductase subunit M